MALHTVGDSEDGGLSGKRARLECPSAEVTEGVESV